MRPQVSGGRGKSETLKREMDERPPQVPWAGTACWSAEVWVARKCLVFSSVIDVGFVKMSFLPLLR